MLLLLLKQVTWLVVTEVRSESFRLVTERCHYNGRHVTSTFTTTHVICWDVFSSSSVVSCAFSVLCVYSKFGHHPHPLGYLCAKFCFFCGLHCWASPRRKIVYSITNLITQSLNHSHSLFDAEAPKLLFRNNPSAVTLSFSVLSTKILLHTILAQHCICSMHVTTLALAHMYASCPHHCWSDPTCSGVASAAGSHDPTIPDRYQLTCSIAGNRAMWHSNFK